MHLQNTRENLKEFISNSPQKVLRFWPTDAEDAIQHCHEALSTSVAGISLLIRPAGSTELPEWHYDTKNGIITFGNNFMMKMGV